MNDKPLCLFNVVTAEHFMFIDRKQLFKKITLEQCVEHHFTFRNVEFNTIYRVLLSQHKSAMSAKMVDRVLLEEKAERDSHGM